MDAVLERLAVDTAGLTALGRGRAGARAAQLVRIAQHLAGLASADDSVPLGSPHS
jgi:hypothetical protein